MSAAPPGRHSIGQRKWFAYVEGTMPPPEREQLDRHLDGCGECVELLRQIRVWEGVIEDEARTLASAVQRRPEEIDRLAQRAIGRIRDTGPHGVVSASPGGLGFEEGVWLLRAVLDPLCGTGAARNAVRLAQEETARGGAAERWAVFVDRLGSAIGAVYGAPVRVLIDRVGMCAGAEAAR